MLVKKFVAICGAVICLTLLVASPSLAVDDKCKAGSTVVVDIGGVNLLMPRDAGTYVRLSGRQSTVSLGRPSPQGYTCETKRIGNVTDITIRGGLTMSVARGSANTPETKMRALVANARVLRDTKFEKLDGGVEKIIATRLDLDLFLLPSSKAPTYNDEPVIVSCEQREENEMMRQMPHYCRVYYVHPSGIEVKYDIQRAEAADDNFFPAEAARRKLLNDMIEGAKNVKNGD